MLQFAVPKEKNCLTVCCNMTSTEPSGKLSVHQHPRLKGERFAFLCAASAQIDCDQPSANIALPPMRQNVWQQEAGMQPDCFSTAGWRRAVSHIKSMAHYFELSILQTGTRPSARDVTLIIVVPPSFALCSADYAHLSTPSFPCSFITMSQFAPEHGVWSRLIAICCFGPPRPPPRLFHNRAAWQGFFKGSLAKGTAPRSNSPHLRLPQSTAAHRRSNPCHRL